MTGSSRRRNIPSAADFVDVSRIPKLSIGERVIWQLTRPRTLLLVAAAIIFVTCVL